MVEKLIYTETTTLEDAIQILDSVGYGVLPVVDTNNTLIGLITDSDIRKAVLNKRLELDGIINKNPIAKDYRLPRKQLINFLRSICRKHLPLIDENNKYVDILILDELEFNTKPNHVIIMAGGLGSRLGDLTKKMPKPMLRVGKKPVLENIITSFSDEGFTKFHVSVNYKSEIIKEYFKDGSEFGVEIQYVEENKRLGTAGALSLIEDEFEHPVFVINGDILTTMNYESLLKFHGENNADMTLCTRTYDYQIPYGVVVSENERIVSLEEKPRYNYSVNAGIYLINPSLLKLLPFNTYYDITDFISLLLEKGYKICSYEISDYWLDIGRVEDYQKAQDDMKY